MAASPPVEPEPTQALPAADAAAHREPDPEPPAAPEAAAPGPPDAASAPPAEAAEAPGDDAVHAPEPTPIGDQAAPTGADEPDGAPSPAVAGPGASDDDDDDFLAELRKAMHDEEPLGPRDTTTPGSPFPDQGDRRSLFGRRR